MNVKARLERVRFNRASLHSSAGGLPEAGDRLSGLWSFDRSMVRVRQPMPPEQTDALNERSRDAERMQQLPRRIQYDPGRFVITRNPRDSDWLRWHRSKFLPFSCAPLNAAERWSDSGRASPARIAGREFRQQAALDRRLQSFSGAGVFVTTLTALSTCVASSLQGKIHRTCCL